MTRYTFFSFHYHPDVQRAQVVRNSWLTQDRKDVGFFDASVFESKQRTSDDALIRFLTNGLKGSSVTAVLFAAQTAYRRWVQFELLKSFVEGKGILAIAIHSIKNFKGQSAAKGPNPLEFVGVEVKNGKAFPKQYLDGRWIWSQDVGAVQTSSLPYMLSEGDNFTFDERFQTYDWGNEGRTRIGDWIENAARAAGR